MNNEYYSQKYPVEPETAPEVVSHKVESDRYAGLEVGSPPYSTLPEVQHNTRDSDKVVLHGQNAGHEPQRRWWQLSRRRLYIVIGVGALIIIAIIVGVVVGVLNSRKGNDNSSDSPQHEEEENSNEEQQGENSTSSKISNDSRLAITGWREGEGFSVRLFYQDGDGNLRVTSMNSDSQEWSPGKAFAKAKQGTSLSAATHNQSLYDPSQSGIQAHVYYIDSDDKIKEHVFDIDDEEGEEGPLNKLEISVAPDSNLGAYWPSVAYQDSSNDLHEARFNCTGDSTTECWDTKDLGLLTQASSALVQVPLRRSGGVMLYYQHGGDQNFINQMWNNNTDTWSAGDLEQPAPASAPFAALAIARGENVDHTNYMILWQDSSGKINYAHRGSSRGFKPPETSAVFDRAKKDTQLTCLNELTSVEDPLHHKVDTNRCFYISQDNEVVQVQWLRGGWADRGVVRSPSEEQEEE